MVLLFADSFQFGIGAGGGLQAIHVVEPQVQFLAVGLDLETVAVVQAGFDKRRVLDGLKLGSRQGRCQTAREEQDEKQAFLHNDCVVVVPLHSLPGIFRLTRATRGRRAPGRRPGFSTRLWRGRSGVGVLAPNFPASAC